METSGSSELGATDVEKKEAGETGAVVRTFLIADVRGYTSYTQAHGDEAAGELAAKFAELARQAISAAGGEVIELRGDEALCVFQSARQALRAALDVQTRFRAREDGEPVFPLGIGVGLASGEAVPVEGGYRGGALNLAARLCSVAGPGQILASETVTSLAGAVDGLRFVPRRAVRLKGMDNPVRVIEVVPEIALPPVPAAPQPTARRRRLIPVVVGLIVLAAAMTAGVLALTRDSAKTADSIGNAVAEVDGKTASYSPVGNTPSTIAVGEGAVWVLNADDRTISKIDPDTNEVVKTFGTGGETTDLAVGEGAVWVGNGARTPGPLALVHTASISRLDPETTLATAPAAALPELPENPAAVSAAESKTLGVSQLAVGAGAVWAINPDRTVSRIDAETGARVKTIQIKAGGAIAAGAEGVWAFSDEAPHVLRIDPRTNRVDRTIELATEELSGLALGDGAVWATDLEAGLLWRIDPDPELRTRSIDVGFGASAVAYGEGAVWVTNFVRDELVRVDPAANRVTARIRLAGTPLSVAAADDTVMVSIAGAPGGETLPASACGRVVTSSGRPDVLIASDLPLQVGEVLRLTVDAIRFVLQKHQFRAGDHRVGYQSCDDSTAQTGFDLIKCASNAKAYGATARVVGVIGPFNSECAWAQIPITNRADGPLAMISPSNTHPGLTHAAVGASDDEPEVYYPTGVRNYARVIAPEDFAGAAAAKLARDLGVRRLYVVKSTVGNPLGAVGDQAKVTGEKLGVRVVGSAEWPEAESYADRAGQVARAHPDGIYFPDLYFEDPDAVIQALRDRLGKDVVLITNESAGHAAPGMYVTTTGRADQSLSRRGRELLREFAGTQPDGSVPSGLYILEAMQATEALLEAIRRSDGTRASVTEELLGLEIKNGILGNFRLDENGDMSPATISVYRITGKRDSDVPDFYGGADFLRTVNVPAADVRAEGAPS
jgi:branched-chain amino acid transport system substrate-binding protein